VDALYSDAVDRHADAIAAKAGSLDISSFLGVAPVTTSRRKGRRHQSKPGPAVPGTRCCSARVVVEARATGAARRVPAGTLRTRTASLRSRLIGAARLQHVAAQVLLRLLDVVVHRATGLLGVAGADGLEDRGVIGEGVATDVAEFRCLPPGGDQEPAERIE
jgi:hypothetical protein